MSWQELHLTTQAKNVDQLSEQLLALGAHAITLQDAGDQAIYEPDPTNTLVWQETQIIGLFAAEQVMDAVLLYANQQQALGTVSHFHLKQLVDQDWVRQSLEQFKPLLFGEKLWVCPSWHTPPHPEAINVMIDPGLAFGTGTHPTTALCLAWLDAHPPKGKTLLDYGCGSGILSLAALKLGAKQVIAIDHDPQALLATKENGKLNQFTPTELCISLPNDLAIAPVDGIMSNILATPLIELANYFAQCLKPAGQIVLSGILNHQAEMVINAYLPWFSMKKPVFSGEWVLLEGIHR